MTSDRPFFIVSIKVQKADVNYAFVDNTYCRKFKISTNRPSNCANDTFQNFHWSLWFKSGRACTSIMRVLTRVMAAIRRFRAFELSVFATQTARRPERNCGRGVATPLYMCCTPPHPPLCLAAILVRPEVLILDWVLSLGILKYLGRKYGRFCVGKLMIWFCGKIFFFFEKNYFFYNKILIYLLKKMILIYKIIFYIVRCLHKYEENV